MKMIAILSLFFALETSAKKRQTILLGPKEFTKKIKATLDEIRFLDAKNFPKKIFPLRLKVEKFTSYQKKICQGEFSTIVLNEFSTQGDNNGKKELKKLDKNERRLCFRELKSIQILFINAVHQARYNYLKIIHQRELEGLNSIKAESLQDLDKTFLNL